MKRFESPTRLLGALSALSIGSACAGDPCEGQRSFEAPPDPDPAPDEPAAVIAGQWLGGGVLELTFSRPVSATGDLDPSRFAIVGWTAIVDDRRYNTREVCELETRYRQLGVGYYYYGQPDITAVWIAPEDPTLLRLRTNIGARCRAAISGTVASGVMLVYTNGERPTEPNDPPPGSQLLDEHGEPLADIGPAWAIDELDACFVSPNCYYVSDLATGHLPELVSLAQIPCP